MISDWERRSQFGGLQGENENVNVATSKKMQHDWKIIKEAITHMTIPSRAELLLSKMTDEEKKRAERLAQNLLSRWAQSNASPEELCAIAKNCHGRDFMAAIALGSPATKTKLSLLISSG